MEGGKILGGKINLTVQAMYSKQKNLKGAYS